MIKKIGLAAIAAAALVSSSYARDQIRIVGSSTVYPFSSKVAEYVGKTTGYPTPVVESTGSGGGLKLFCAGNGMDTPDITNASRRMKAKEFTMCEKNGVTDITEAMIGMDGIALAQNKNNAPFNVTKKQLMLAVTKLVPDGKGGLIENPYKKWSDVDSALPNRDIVIYGPPTSSGTRDAFEDMIIKSITKKHKDYVNNGQKKYHEIREDGAYVPSGENDNLIVQKLNKNPEAFGIFGYSFLEENGDKVQGAKINGVAPTPKTIASGDYPVSRSLFFYIKNSHADKVPAMDKYVETFMSKSMIGQRGKLKSIGLIPLGKAEYENIAKAVAKREKLTLDDLK